MVGCASKIMISMIWEAMVKERKFESTPAFCFSKNEVIAKSQSYM